MKKIITLILLIAISSCENKDSADCITVPCPRPNINDLIELTLNFSNSAIGDQIVLIRINKADKSTIDTVQLALPANKGIVIGSGGTVGFTEPTSGGVFEQATLDYRVVVSPNQSNDITNIEIERYLTQDECGCADYQISTLELDGQTVEVNSKNYMLDL